MPILYQDWCQFMARSNDYTKIEWKIFNVPMKKVHFTNTNVQLYLQEPFHSQQEGDTVCGNVHGGKKNDDGDNTCRRH